MDENGALAAEPVCWFYGLMAERVAEFTPAPHQLLFLRGEIERFGQPVLDVGCGVGRLLLPLLEAGIDIDGCDISDDMLHQCQKKAATLGVEPRLYQQAMHTLDLPRKYRTIFICELFQSGRKPGEWPGNAPALFQPPAGRGSVAAQHRSRRGLARRVEELGTRQAQDFARTLAGRRQTAHRCRWQRIYRAAAYGQHRSAGAADGPPGSD